MSNQRFITGGAVRILTTGKGLPDEADVAPRFMRFLSRDITLALATRNVVRPFSSIIRSGEQREQHSWKSNPGCPA
jgi:hypothetical protein